MKGRLLFIFALAAALITFTLRADEVDESQVQARQAETERQKLDPLFNKLKGLESTLGEANVVQEASMPKSIVAAAAEAKPEEAKPVVPPIPESRPSSGAWANVVPPKDTSARVGEIGGDKNSPPPSPTGQGLMNQPSTSTLSLGDLGNAKKVLSTFEDITRNRNAIDKSMGTMNGVVAQARNLGMNANNKEKTPEKKEASGSKLDPDNNSTKSKFGDTNDLTLGNISKNNDGEKKDSIKEMMDKALASKDKNKEKEEQKKKEEKQKLEKQLGELVERDPFKFEDYEALRDMFNEKSDMAQEILAQNPKLKELKDKIMDDFAPRDAAPASKKEPLLNFLADKDSAEKFASPINVDPTSPRVQVRPGHSGE